MPCTIIPHVPIGFCDGDLKHGEIAAINLDPLSSYYFEVKLDDEPGAHYAMRYDSVLLYAYDEQPGFSQFCLKILHWNIF
jgi:hypothetical protein